ncbi:hypothetical protein HPO96_19840 [Kribbella sandramycini]|uniref:Uncharacterized protein n=1 Tax=Kribbella sandramycini TaxID=60450 RepID=A0A7Y4L1B5_9ACTN|nr:hypothetical protein [Kribbella sandramycini]MBB6564803.1 hypothetical protein [Kribbella sandramycini]NOL42502.1 hypothetical protein [Kribbella sandramycini]
MNLQDLRTELSTRAGETGDHPDLLPGVRQKIHRTKQRRAATAVASVAAVAAVAIAVVPGVVTNTQPDPSSTAPSDYERDGISIPGRIGADKLLGGWIGNQNQDRFSFSWTPTTNHIAVRATCTTESQRSKSVEIRIGQRVVATAQCNVGATITDTYGEETRPDSPLWLTTPVGRNTTVTADVIDSDTREPGDKTARVAVGIYSTTGSSDFRAVPQPGPRDFQDKGVVYRRQVGGDTLLGAAVSEPGAKEVRFRFTGTGAPLKLQPFCTADEGPLPTAYPYSVAMSIDGQPELSMSCGADSTDAGAVGSATFAAAVPAGREVEAVIKLRDGRKGTSTVPDNALLALGVYAQGPQRTVGGVQFDERIEIGGRTYRFDSFRSAPGPQKKVTIDAPVNQEFVLAYGGKNLGSTAPVQVQARAGTEIANGIEVEDGNDLGVGKDVIPAGPARTAAVVVTQGEPTGGTLAIAIYLPV